jgi:hypothetical protein
MGVVEKIVSLIAVVTSFWKDGSSQIGHELSRHDVILVNQESKHLAVSTPFHIQTHIKVVCEADNFSHQMEHMFSRLISGRIKYSNETIIQPNCPCSYDMSGKCHQAKHFCHVPMTDYACSFHVRNATVTQQGAIMAGRLYAAELLVLSDVSLVGERQAQYLPAAVSAYNEWVTKTVSAWRSHPTVISRHVKTLVPTRMFWDDCFNHLSFQSMPLIGLVYEFHHDLFYSTHWQVSRFTGALLILLGIRQERLVVEESVFAKEVVLPWMKYWNPISGAPLQGIARRVSLIATRRLLSMQLSDQVVNHVDRLIPWDARYQPMTLNVSADAADNIRYVVYFNRTMGGTRTVVNEAELLGAISEHLRPGYRLVVLPPTKEYKSIPELHAVWQQYARIVNRAAVMIGAHGGGLNNMMWTPDDCDLIEFNENLDDEHYTQSHGQTPVRRVFMNAFFARSAPMPFHVGEGASRISVNSSVQALVWQPRHWTIRPVKRHFQDFYVGRVKICVRDLLQVLAQVPRYGRELILRPNEHSLPAKIEQLVENPQTLAPWFGLLRDNTVWEKMETESVGTFTVPAKFQRKPLRGKL